MITALYEISPLNLALSATVIAILSVILAALDLAAESWANPLDHTIGHYIIRHRTITQTYFMQQLSWLGGPFGISLVIFFSLLFLVESAQLQVAGIFTAVITASIVYVLGMKLLTARKRPTWRVLERERTYSFPSAHSLISTTVYGSVFVIFFHATNSWLPILFITCLLIGIAISRVYLGCHYVSDVIAGIIGGTVWVYIFAHLLYSL